MPNGNAAAESPLRLPPDLQSDHRKFTRALAPWLERIDLKDGSRTPASDRASPAHDISRLLTEFGLLVYAQANRLSVIAKGDRPAIYSRHILDSLNPVSLFPLPPRSMLDVGSGGGFPGIPLAIAWPETQITLLESREKKSGFLEKVVRELGLRNVAVVCARLEEFGTGWTAGDQEAVSIRAIGGLSKLLGHLTSICAPQARWVYFLGKGTSEGEVIGTLGPFGDGAITATGEFGGRLLHARFPA